MLKSKKTKVLLIKSSLPGVKKLTTALHKLRHPVEVLCAVDGADAIKLLEHYLPHIIILHLQLADTSAMSILKIIKIRNKGSHVIVLTDNENAYEFNQCLQLAADGYYHKSTEFEDVMEHIATLIDKN